MTPPKKFLAKKYTGWLNLKKSERAVFEKPVNKVLNRCFRSKIGDGRNSFFCQNFCPTFTNMMQTTVLELLNTVISTMEHNLGRPSGNLK